MMTMTIDITFSLQFAMINPPNHLHTNTEYSQDSYQQVYMQIIIEHCFDDSHKMGKCTMTRYLSLVFMVLKNTDVHTYITDPMFISPQIHIFTVMYYVHFPHVKR